MVGEIDRLTPKGHPKVTNKKIDDLDLPGWFTKIEHSINEKKEGFEDELRERMQEIVDRPDMEL